VITALLEIADSRFQDHLIQEARRAGKISEDYRLPEHARNNRPERLKKLLARYRERGMFPDFPFGTDLTKEEVVLRKALLAFKQTVQWEKVHLPQPAEIRKTITVPDDARPYLERMELDRPQSIKERLLQRAVVYALASINAI
jgi:hypothetical protein